MDSSCQGSHHQVSVVQPIFPGSTSMSADADAKVNYLFDRCKFSTESDLQNAMTGLHISIPAISTDVHKAPLPDSLPLPFQAGRIQGAAAVARFHPRGTGTHKPDRPQQVGQAHASPTGNNKSDEHSTGLCKPCVYLQSRRICFNGKDCLGCHKRHSDLKKRNHRPSKGVRNQCKELAQFLHDRGMSCQDVEAYVVSQRQDLSEPMTYQYIIGAFRSLTTKNSLRFSL
mmetsp:Transcript_36109/g.58280  ORF Transcript_36109/g.58280 Transcript_36109/m.58280 type:complete len:228 (-) Transcript_36109:75-758(-)